MINKILLPIRLGDGFVQKLKFLGIILWFPIRRKLGISGKDHFHVELKAFGKGFDFYPTDGSDIGILQEVFVDKEYEIEGLSPKVIFDLGSNVGISSMYFKLTYPESIVHAYEPDPVTCEKLKRNTNQFAGVHIHNCAISDKSGTMDFFIYPGSSMSSSLYRRQIDQRSISVPTKTLEQAMIDSKVDVVDLLKFDVEGSEFSVFENSKVLEKVGYIIGEVHEDISARKVDEFISFFNGFILKNQIPTLNRRYILEFQNKSDLFKHTAPMIKDTKFYDAESVKYSGKRYPHIASDYIQFFFKKRLELTVQVIEDLFQRKMEMSLLEVGCADGVVLREIIKNMEGAFSHIVGIDISPGMIYAAQVSTDSSKAEFFVRGKEPANATYNLIIEVGVANYTDFDAELAYAKTHMKKGGVYILSIAGKGSLNDYLGGGVGYQNFFRYSEYERHIRGVFSIQKIIPVGLRIPFIWRMPVFARTIQSVCEIVLRKVFPNLFHEKIYILTQE